MKKKMLCGFLVIIVLLFASCAKKDQKTTVLPMPDNTGKLVGISYSFGSFNGGYWEYEIVERDGKLYFTAMGSNGVDLDIDAKISEKELEKFEKIIEDRDILGWNGFSERDDDILDGYSFSLSADYEDTTLTASGYEIYPDNYETAHKALFDCFKELSDSLS